MKISALMTDYYELTMMQGYFLENLNPDVVFDMFYRSQPFSGGYAVFTGLQDLLTALEELKFEEEEISYLESLKTFHPEFLAYLRDFSFTGSLYAMDEGTVVFPGEPLIRVHSTLIEAQLIESFLLNTINFQTLIATKASRIVNSAKNGKVLEFGLRRAQGVDGALSASRAAFVGGAAATSNTLAGKNYGIPVSGTMAHSWIMAYESELEAFRAFAKLYPDSCILLIDTFDTLGSGIENAIIVGKEQQKKGKNIGVRIDSGDLSYLSKEVRKRLDKAGLAHATIAVSNDLTEEIVQLLIADGAPINAWGIGTHLVTGGSQASMNGVYKLCAKKDANGIYQPTVKVSNTWEKTTNPGIKQVYRFYSHEGNALGDLISFDEENMTHKQEFTFYHPMNDSDYYTLSRKDFATITPLLSCKMKNGKSIDLDYSIYSVQQNAEKELMTLHDTYKRIINPHVYKVSLSKQLKDLKKELIMRYRKGK